MTKNLNLGEIERVDLREVWNNEAKDFTPWLAESISNLGELLGMDLELETQEAPVGSFSLDVLAQDVGTNRQVIIENQLEATNHDHLGKLLTYASGFDAGVIVWIAREFREEHRQALDWLNRRSDENTEFFGVRVEVWRIDDSRFAPHFTVVVSPNNWQRESRQRVRNREPSDKLMKYQQFFLKLFDAMREKGLTNAKRAQPLCFYEFTSGHGSQYKYQVRFTATDTVQIGLYIFGGSGSKDWNKERFDEIVKYRETIEERLGEPLTWERLDDKSASRIALYRDASIEDDEAKLNDVRNWLVEKFSALKTVFGDYIG